MASFGYGHEIMLFFVGIASLMVLARALFGREALEQLFSVCAGGKRKFLKSSNGLHQISSGFRKKSNRSILLQVHIMCECFAST